MHDAAVFRAEVPAGPGLRPTQVRLTDLRAWAALLSFEFAFPGGSTGRRTLVLRRVGDEWRIARIHASNTEPAWRSGTKKNGSPLAR